MLSFGFDTCIKVNSPFINCLINDTLLDANILDLGFFTFCGLEETIGVTTNLLNEESGE